MESGVEEKMPFPLLQPVLEAQQPQEHQEANQQARHFIPPLLQIRLLTFSGQLHRQFPK